MTNKSISILLCILGFLLFGNFAFQTYFYNSYLSKSPKFTAFEAQELCERVLFLERNENEKNNKPTYTSCSYIERY